MFGISRSTLYLEIERGTVEQIRSDLTYRKYFADVAQRVYEKNIESCHNHLKLEKVGEFINYAEDKILKEKQSPDSVCGRAKLFNLFKEIVCTKTLYNYIERGLLKIKNIDLVLKVRRKPKRHSKHENIKKLGESIENRPQEINDRISFGHGRLIPSSARGQKMKYC